MHPQQVKVDTKLVEVVVMPEGRAVIQGDFRKLEWTNKNSMKFNEKSGRRQLCREDLRIQMGSKLARTRQRDLEATKASRRLGCVGKNMASRLREGVLLLCASVTVDAHTKETKELEGPQSSDVQGSWICSMTY